LRSNASGLGSHPKTDSILAEAIKRGLNTRVVGHSMVFLDETTSTNDEAKGLAAEGAAEGTVVLAKVQTAGRGRLGREWYSPQGGVWMSVILKPDPDRVIQKITLLAGLTVAKTLRTFYKINAVLKWPNDVLVGDKKICGILTEGTFEGERPLYVVVGIGLNANIDEEALPEELRSKATSIKKLIRKEVSIIELLRHLLKTLDQDYQLFVSNKDEKLWSEYAKLCATIGSDVRVDLGEGEVYEGRAEGISPEGGLIIKTLDGSKVTVLGGDCIHLKTKRKHEKG
jgi:BirA family biotin operon repressor/biotin-[acetyl-CoA-carboxylase] ligase